MTKLLEEAFAFLARMPSAAQDDIAQALLGMAYESDLEDIEPEHRDAVIDGMMQAERGDLASRNVEEIVATAFRRARQ